jgi:hypothetical protein
VLAKTSRLRELFSGHSKIVLARRQNQHSRRARYPDERLESGAIFTKLLLNRNSTVTRRVQCIAMDIDALHSALLSITLVTDKLHFAREHLPEVAETLAKSLQEAENELRVAKATLAGELDFSFCPHCWPPEVVTTDAHGRVHCPSCGPISLDQAA